MSDAEFASIPLCWRVFIVAAPLSDWIVPGVP
jgi:hypothetical protein